MSVTQIAYTVILGLPAIIWGGMLTLAMFVLAASVGFLNTHGIRIIKFKHHKTIAYIAIAMAVIHGSMAMLSYLGY